MSNEEQNYVTELKNQISNLEEKLKNLTEERNQLLVMAQQYQAEYVLRK